MWYKKSPKSMLLMLLAAACVLSLGGCFSKGSAEGARIRRLAEERALAYILDKYGLTASVTEIEVGTAGGYPVPNMGSDALVTMNCGDETFYVYLDTADAAVCCDSMEGQRLADAFDRHFRGLYPLPEADGSRVFVTSATSPFGLASFAARHNIIDFPYDGQSIEDMLPRLSDVCFEYDFVSSDVSFSQIDIAAADWFGALDKVRIQLRCFQEYDETLSAPFGVKMRDGQPVLCSDGVDFPNFTRFERDFPEEIRKNRYFDAIDTNSTQKGFALRETLRFSSDRGVIRSAFRLTQFGNIWVKSSDSIRAEDYLELADARAWSGHIEQVAAGSGVFRGRGETPEKWRPYFDAQYQQLGDMVCLKPGAVLPEGESILILFPMSEIYDSSPVVGIGSTVSGGDGQDVMRVELWDYQLTADENLAAGMIERFICVLSSSGTRKGVTGYALLAPAGI